MRLNELLGLGIHPRDVVLEFGPLDPPLTPPAHLDRGKVTAADEGVRLGCGDVQRLRDVRKGEESGCHVLIVPNAAADEGFDPRPVDNFRGESSK